MARGGLPSFCFILSASSFVSTRHPHPLSPLKPTNLLRIARPILRASVEEELFIRREAGLASENPSPQHLNPPQQEPEEQFDFVRGDEKTPSPITSPESPKLTDESTPVKDKIQGDQRIGITAPIDLKGMTLSLRRELDKFVTESQVVGKVRMPTRRATVLFAWDLALVLALLILLRAGVSSILRWIHNRLNTTRGLQTNIPYEASVFECMQRPLEFLSLFTVGTALAEAVSRPLAAIGLLKHIRTLRELGIIISATWFLLRWIERIRSRFSVAKSIDKAQVDATSRIATVITFVASALISLDTIGINVQTVLAFGGIGGVAIGFAGREIISNFFGGFMIYVTRPFSVGEWIRSIEEEELNGTVEDIGWYLTRVRTWDKRPLYIPNSRFSTLIVENGSRMDNRRILHTLHVRHEDMPVVPSMIAAMESLLMSHQELDPRQHRLVYVDSFGEYSVKIWLSCYTKSVFLYDYRRVQQDILVKCYEIIRKHGAKLATTNTRDVRPGANTDRYGPLGSTPISGFNAQSSQERDSIVASEGVHSDVPLRQQHGSTPVVRFNTIESGIDLSGDSKPVAPNSQPANQTVPSTRNDKVVREDHSTGYGKQEGADAEPQRSASTAAVAAAAAAAALAAARRNAARIEDNNKTNSQGASVVGANVPDDGMSGADASPKVAPSQGGMKISAGKAVRNLDGGDGILTGSDRGMSAGKGAGEMKITAGKPSRGVDGVDGAKSGSDSSKAVSQGQAEMKISTGKGVRGAGVDEGVKSGMDAAKAGSPGQGEMKLSAAKPLRNSEVGDAGRASSEPTLTGGQAGSEMKISAGKPGRPGANDGATGGVETGKANSQAQGEMKISAAKPSRSCGGQGGAGTQGSNGVGDAKLSEKRVGEEGGSLASKRHVAGGGEEGGGKGGNAKQKQGNIAGEMKISKARKPLSGSRAGGDGEKPEQVPKAGGADAEGR